MRTSLTVDTHKKFHRIYIQEFFTEARSRVNGWGNFLQVTQQLHYPFADVAVLSSENASDKKSITEYV